MTVCAWCRSSFEPTRRDAVFCKKRCRQAAFRLRRRAETTFEPGESLRFAYADPPYPGLAKRYYGNEPTYAGEVDHAALVAQLEAGGYAGWALSTASRSLRDVLPLCPKNARVCAWVKPLEPSPNTFGLHSTWEPIVVVRGRQERPGRRDWLLAAPARGGGEDLPGRKPLAFCAFLFAALGMRPGDGLDDLFPGTGIVSRAWAEIGRGVAVDLGDVSLAPGRDASPRAASTGGVV